MVKRSVIITLEKAIEWYNSDDESLKDLALQAFSKEELIYNFRDITTFKKACDILDYNYDDIVSKVNSIAEISKASAAMFKLNIVRKALNLGYDMHISRNVDGQKYSHYPFFALVIKGSTCYRGAKEIDKYEKLGEFTSERTIYEIFHVGVYSDIDYKGLGKYNPDRRYSFISIDTGLLGCATEDISRHLGKYFGMLIMEAMYADIVDFEIVEEKYKI